MSLAWVGLGFDVPGLVTIGLGVPRAPKAWGVQARGLYGQTPVAAPWHRVSMVGSGWWWGGGKWRGSAARCHAARLLRIYLPHATRLSPAPQRRAPLRRCGSTAGVGPWGAVVAPMSLSVGDADAQGRVLLRGAVAGSAALPRVLSPCSLPISLLSPSPFSPHLPSLPISLLSPAPPLPHLPVGDCGTAHPSSDGPAVSSLYLLGSTPQRVRRAAVSNAGARTHRFVCTSE